MSSLLKGTPYEALEANIQKSIGRKLQKRGKISDEKNVDSNSRKRQRSSGVDTKSSEVATPSHTASLEVPRLQSSVGGRDWSLKRPKKSNSDSIPESTETENPFNNNRTIYIQGLPFDAADEQVADFFKECGEVLSCRLPKWHDSGKLKGYGHVEFKSSASVLKALELNGEYMGDRYIIIERPQTPRALQSLANAETKSRAKPAGCKTVFVKNLPYDGKLSMTAVLICSILEFHLVYWSMCHGVSHC
jgi:RNA recognition motif-containing protein